MTSPTGEPAPGVRFDHSVTVTETDIDANGHANNVVYLHWAQEAAVAHWKSVVEPDASADLSRVVVRHEFDFKRPAYRADALVATTWVGEITATTKVRSCEIVRIAD